MVFYWFNSKCLYCTCHGGGIWYWFDLSLAYFLVRCLISVLLVVVIEERCHNVPAVTRWCQILAAFRNAVMRWYCLVTASCHCYVTPFIDTVSEGWQTEISHPIISEVPLTLVPPSVILWPLRKCKSLPAILPSFNPPSPPYLHLLFSLNFSHIQCVRGGDRMVRVEYDQW